MTNARFGLLLTALGVLLAAIPLGATAIALVAVFLLGVTINELARRGP